MVQRCDTWAHHHRENYVLRLQEPDMALQKSVNK
jgi:hypothetical protein